MSTIVRLICPKSFSSQLRTALPHSICLATRLPLAHISRHGAQCDNNMLTYISYSYVWRITATPMALRL